MMTQSQRNGFDLVEQRIPEFAHKFALCVEKENTEEEYQNF